MDDWQQVDGVQRRTRTYVVRGRLHAAGIRSPETELLITDFVHGGVPYRAEGTLPGACWDRLTHPLADRRLRLIARDGPSILRSDDVVPDGAHSEGRGRVRFTLSFNHALQESRLPPGSLRRARASVTFGDVPFCRFEVDHRRGVLAGKTLEVRASDWRLRFAPRLEGPEPGPALDGFLLPGRVEVGLRGTALNNAVVGARARSIGTLRDLAEDISAVLSMLTLHRRPWLAVSFAKPGLASDTVVVMSRPAFVQGPMRKPGLIFQDHARCAVGAALRFILRLRASDPGAANVLRHIMFLFASAVEDRSSQRAWYAIAQSIDLLGSVAMFRGNPTAEERRRAGEELRDLDRVLRFAQHEALCGPLQQRLKQLRGQISSPSYLKGMQAVVRHQGVQISDLGGDDLLCDLRDIRNALMHRSSMGEEDITKLQRRGAKRNLAFSTDPLSTDRVALQMMHDRHESALTLLARVLLRVTRVPERCAPRVWTRGALGSMFE